MTLRLKLLILALWGFLTKKINGPHVVALIVKADTGLFAISSGDYGVGRILRRNGCYGRDEVERLKPFLTTNSDVLIVGAHIGTLAVPISRLCNEVIAIEPNPITFDLLTKNIALNAIYNCQAINIAASSKEEKIQFLLSKSNSGGSKRVPIKGKYMYYYDRPAEVTVNAYGLDEYLHMDQFDIVIMDIEGSEYFALKGMQKILSKARLLVVEFLPHHLKNVSGVTVQQFLSVIEPHFSKLVVPTKNVTVEAKSFVPCLTDMYDRGDGDPGIIFQKC